jgi:hypothetical protein
MFGLDNKAAWQRQTEPRSQPARGVSKWTGLGLASAEALRQTSRKAPKTWCRVRAADGQYPLWVHSAMSVLVAANERSGH